ncbi:MAG TPA: chloride channel protein [Candidatus Yaniella excrementigallinarum]|nr:chloride channel protein [Candidatus Yaniella excrementigallinarum]
MADSRLNEHPNNDAESNSTPPYEMVYRRAPIITPFLVTGGIFGVLVAFIWGGFAGGTEDYTQFQTVSFFSIAFAIIGMAIGALVWLMLDRRSKSNTATMYAKRTQDPDAADVAVSEDDYSQWSQFQQKQRIEQSRREQLEQAKAKAEAEKHNKRK